MGKLRFEARWSEETIPFPSRLSSFPMFVRPGPQEGRWKPKNEPFGMLEREKGS